MAAALESTLSMQTASLQAIETELRDVNASRSPLSTAKMFDWHAPKFNEIVDAFRADPVAALSKYSEMQTEHRRKQEELDALTIRSMELTNRKTALEREIRETRAAIRRAEKEEAMAPFIEKYSTWEAGRLRTRAETVYEKLGDKMSNSAACNKFGWGHDPSDPAIISLDLELDAVAKVLLGLGVKVSYKDNTIQFADAADPPDDKRRRTI